MRVVRAKHAGACYGVQRALETALAVARERGEAFTLGPLIHNPVVVDDLEKQGVHVARDVEDVTGDAVVIRSHGVAPSVRRALEARGVEVVDATCPHVERAQRAAAELAAQGCAVLVVGEAGHPEVEGITAWAREAASRVEVVAAPADIPDDLYEPVGVVVQTTQTRENLDAVVDALVARGFAPEVRDTICAATRKRQQAACELAARADAMVVVGGRNSSNTTRLAEICAQSCGNVLHVESPEELVRHAAALAACNTVGVTAGASTPDQHIEAVASFLEAL